MKKIVESCDIVECARVIFEGLEYEGDKCDDTVATVAMLLRDNLGVREGKELGELTFEKFRDFTDSLNAWFGEDLADMIEEIVKEEHRTLPMPTDMAAYAICGQMATDIVHDVLGMEVNQTDLSELKASLGL